MYFFYGTMDLVAILNVTLVTVMSFCLLLFPSEVYTWAARAHYCTSLYRTYLFTNKALFGSPVVGLNMYLWIFPWCIANVPSYLSSEFTLVLTCASDSNTSSQAFHATDFSMFFSSYFLNRLRVFWVLPQCSCQQQSAFHTLACLSH